MDELAVRLVVLLLGAVIGGAWSLWSDWRGAFRQRAVDRLGRLDRLPLPRRNPAYDGFMRALRLR